MTQNICVFLYLKIFKYQFIYCSWANIHTMVLIFFFLMCPICIPREAVWKSLLPPFAKCHLRSKRIFPSWQTCLLNRMFCCLLRTAKKTMKSQKKTLKRIRKQRSLRHKTQLAKSQIRSPLFQIFRSTKWLWFQQTNTRKNTTNVREESWKFWVPNSVLKS